MVNKYINATYQEIIDLSTSPDKVTIMGLHTPSGAVPSKMLEGLWKQFKSVKYNGADVVLRATAVQPLDPLQVGNTSGTQMDMRDLQNPILFRGCHGESLGSILNDLMGNFTHDFDGDSMFFDQLSISDVENFYYQCLTDMSWKKSMPQNGFAFNGLHPLVYKVATNFQLNDSGTGGVTVDNKVYNQAVGRPTDDIVDQSGLVRNDPFNVGVQVDRSGDILSRTPRMMFSHDLEPMGWFDTENVVGNSATDLTPNVKIPLAYMGILMLPPSYTSGVVQYYRMVITHYFTFKDFRSISLDSDYSSTPGYYDTVTTNGKLVLTSARVR